MALPEERLRYALTDEQHERIFQRLVLPTMLPPSGSVVSPVAVILGGQPGAGKTRLLNTAARELQMRGPLAVINGDDLRSFHPACPALQRDDPLNAAHLTDHDSGRWVEKLIAAARDRRVNLVIESTMRRPEVFICTGGQLLAAGYQVEAWAMAVPERLSWQGVHQRYEAMLAAGSAARFTVREAHDAGAAGMLDTLGRIEQDGLAGRVMVGTRLEAYLKRHRPQLAATGNRYLFPDTGTGGRSAHDMAVYMTELVERRTGCEFNLHLVRHFVVALFLERHPGHYDTARLILGHAKSSCGFRRKPPTYSNLMPPTVLT